MKKERYPHEQLIEWVDDHLIALLVIITIIIIGAGFGRWIATYTIQPYGCCEMGKFP
jgi:hypothetical protein